MDKTRLPVEVSKLEMVNDMLATLGETPVSSLNISHPYISMATQVIDRLDLQLQSQNWWFNTSKATLTPDPVTKYLLLPASTTDFIIDGNKYIMRGRRVYNKEDRTFEIEEELTGILKERIPLDELPPTALVYLRQIALQEFTIQVQGHDKAELYRAATRDAFSVLHQQQVRHANQNVFSTRDVMERKWR